MKVTSPFLKRFWNKNASIVIMLLCMLSGAYLLSLAMGKVQEAAAINKQIEICKTVIIAGEKKLTAACTVLPKSVVGKRLVTWEEMPLLLDAMFTSAQRVGGIDIASWETAGGVEGKPLLNLESAIITESPIKIVTNGTYGKTMAFLANMERIPYITQVDSLVMEGGTMENDQRSISLALTLRVFVYEMVVSSK